MLYLASLLISIQLSLRGAATEDIHGTLVKDSLLLLSMLSDITVPSECYVDNPCPIRWATDYTGDDPVSASHERLWVDLKIPF